MTTTPKRDYVARHTEIHRLREQGRTIRAIAQAVGLTAGGVHKALQRPPGAPDGRGRRANSAQQRIP